MRFRKEKNWKNVSRIMLLLSVGTIYASPESPEAQVPVPVAQEVQQVQPDRNRVEQCALRLLESAGKVGLHAKELPALYTRASVMQEEEFLEYLMAIIYVESKFNRDAISPAGARGLMQLMEIAVKEAVGSCSFRPLGDINKLHDSYTNVKYGSCFLSKLYRDMEGDWTRTLIAYNGGYRALAEYDKGNSINHETSNYVLKVKRAVQTICRKNN